MSGRAHVPPAVAGLLAAAIVALAGCGGGGHTTTGRGTPATDAADGVGLVRAGSTAQFADCSDWRGGTAAQRRVTVASIRDQLTPQRSESAASALPDDAAYRLFDKVCSSGVADTLRLYKVYARAQVFAPLEPDADDTGH